MSELPYKEAIIAETRRRIIEESIPRIKYCLAELSEEQIWYKANKNTNAMGNLVLHLCGNVRQWIMHGLGGQIDERNRDLEFSEKGPIGKADLVYQLDRLASDLETTLDSLADCDLLKVRRVQDFFEESGISILIHVIEHFSYHTGQITYYTKMVRDINTDYYSEFDL